MANRWGNNGNSDRFIFLGSKITANGDCSHEIKSHFLLGRKVMTNLDSLLKSRDITFADKGLSSQSYGFSRSHVWTWELDHEEGWAPKSCGVGEEFWESLEQQGDQPSQSQRKSILNIHWKDWCWSSNTLATWCKELTHWKRPWCWERLRAGGEGAPEARWLNDITNS